MLVKTIHGLERRAARTARTSSPRLWVLSDDMLVLAGLVAARMRARG